MARIAINGFGRIGRCVTRVLFDRADDDLELVAVNDLTDAETLAHLLKYDSVHRTFAKEVSAEGKELRIGDRKIPVLSQKDPAELPWKDLGVDIVLECTGLFRKKADAEKHIAAGAKGVIISAPGKGDIDGTFCVGINSDQLDPAKHRVVSNASCTTNCLAPIVKVLHESFEVKKGHMVTVHAYTNDRGTLDGPHSDLRRARAAAVSMIPTSTGAASAIGLVIPELQGKLSGSAIRVPTPDVSITCLTAQIGKEVDAEAVNQAFRDAADGALRGILAVEDGPLVSTDYIGDPRSSIVDAQLTAVQGDLVQVQSWYDNEWGFSCRMVDLARLMTKGS